MARRPSPRRRRLLSKPFEPERLLESIGTLLGLTWTHAAAPAATPHPAAGAAAAELVVPPPAQMAALHQLALAGDMRAIRHHADSLVASDPRYTPFAQTLRQMALAYQSKVLLELVEGYLRKEQAT